MDDGPSEALIEALTRLWRIPAPGPEKLRVTSAFKWLGKTALWDYPGAHNGRASTSFEFALEGALRTLGLPCLLPAGRHGPHVPPAEAARLLDRAFRATQCRRRYLVPLDQAGDLPALTFGPVRLAKFSEAELRELIDATFTRSSLTFVATMCTGGDRKRISRARKKLGLAVWLGAWLRHWLKRTKRAHPPPVRNFSAIF
jgi:hypothetical protein